MKKLLALFLCMTTILSISVTALAADTSYETGTHIGYADYYLSELVDANALSAIGPITANKDATVSKVEARLFNGATGIIVGTSPTFRFTGVPTGAKITNVQAWNPSKSNISQGKFTAIENIQVFCGSQASGFFKF